jgi:hypothetical protein
MRWKRRSVKSPQRILVIDNSFEDTHMTENKASTRKKRKQLDHLEGEFKKINPSTFDGESKTGEEDEA